MDNQEFQVVIEPAKGWFHLNLKEILRYRDLIFLFVKRNFTAQYKQTILGPAWAVIQPLLTTVVFTFVFGNMAGLADCGLVPTFLFYMIGNIAWQYFSGCLTGTANTFLTNSNVMGKVYFPRLVMPISTVLTQLISFGIQMVMFILFMGIYLFVPGYQTEPNLYLLMVPVLVLQMGMLSLGCGIIISALTTKYRDLSMLITFGVQLWMYGSPVAYSLSTFENSSFYVFVNLNPMTPIIEMMRYAFLGGQAASIDWFFYGISWAFTVVVLVIGVILFNRVEKTFMDTI